ncbi:hypothetical protein CC85DRAFT_287530 [Cutaneotrichosporon oleaginosum]|uniref:Methyltransferase n=1 Tax=Cutaneotrichosporon oleaginosum TaxID=879819 RepID=A0A0J1AYN5_9TREE|nr:uncharacterized protein CC85DRAFT_287530 [Cutaneotrichosporon oleaginosum]KLT40424.1 hypothetical protein CC85DRAFT_287530 [Cutaneotrichosporon oleaginosum]TXT11389.1 hypothetical protein COLE_01799 [Cutaneotrichosporon oleaginosum]
MPRLSLARPLRALHPARPLTAPTHPSVRPIVPSQPRTMVASTHATFKYFDPSSVPAGQKAWNKVDVRASSFKDIAVSKPVYNARDDADDFRDVDRTGFAFHTSPSSVPASAVLADGPEVRTAYYAEVEAALRAKLATGDKVSRVVIFDHTIRVRDPTAARQPVQSVHVDQTPAAAAARVRRHTGADAERLLKGRFQLINVWRPLGHAASDHPLAVVDWRTTEESDLVATDLLYPVYEGYDGDDRGREVAPRADLASTDGYEVRGETYNVQPNDRHRFYYVKDMRPDEVMFIKCFDSASEGVAGNKGVAGFTPHTAFEDPNTPEDAKPRQSIEVRALVFYD